MNQALTHLADTSIEQFMKEDWHIRPRLFKNAFKKFEPLCDIETIFEMASDEDIESRLVQQKDGEWALAQGPFEELPDLQEPKWTVLIQGLDHHLPEAYDLLQQFRFIPDARLDDIMLSLASDGGGVGPHYDSYDVFLIQMHGQRRWRIGPIGQAELVEGAPLKLLRNFEPTEEFVLNPGDMLYLPPNYGHDGVAQGICSTLSVGFRALNEAEVLSTILRDMADQIECDSELKSKLFSDPARGIEVNPAILPQDLLNFGTRLLNKLEYSEAQIEKSMGKLLTEPKPHVYFQNNTEDMTIPEIISALIERGIALSMKTRMLVLKEWVFINGEAIQTKTETTKKIFENLAKYKQIEPNEAKVAMHNEEFKFFILGFVKAGWIETLC